MWPYPSHIVHKDLPQNFSTKNFSTKPRQKQLDKEEPSYLWWESIEDRLQDEKDDNEVQDDHDDQDDDMDDLLDDSLNSVELQLYSRWYGRLATRDCTEETMRQTTARRCALIVLDLTRSTTVAMWVYTVCRAHTVVFVNKGLRIEYSIGYSR